jgi:hypothetical protein
VALFPADISSKEHKVRHRIGAIEAKGSHQFEFFVQTLPEGTRSFSVTVFSCFSSDTPQETDVSDPHLFFRETHALKIPFVKPLAVTYHFEREASLALKSDGLIGAFEVPLTPLEKEFGWLLRVRLHNISQYPLKIGKTDFETEMVGVYFWDMAGECINFVKIVGFSMPNPAGRSGKHVSYDP